MEKNLIAILNKDMTLEEEINGTKYIFQRLPVRAAMEMRQGWQDMNGNPIAVKMADALLENIVVQPNGLTIDSFDRVSDVEKVTSRALAFQYGDEKN